MQTAFEFKAHKRLFNGALKVASHYSSSADCGDVLITGTETLLLG